MGKGRKKPLQWRPGKRAMERKKSLGPDEWELSNDMPKQPPEPTKPKPPEYTPGKCMRCKCDMDTSSIAAMLQVVCDTCWEKDPRLNVYEMTARNKWHDIDFLETIIEVVRDPKWCWAYNWECKYLNVRIDMRDGGCIVDNDNGQRITPDGLKWQISNETPERPIH